MAQAEPGPGERHETINTEHSLHPGLERVADAHTLDALAFLALAVEELQQYTADLWGAVEQLHGMHREVADYVGHQLGAARVSLAYADDALHVGVAGATPEWHASAAEWQASARKRIRDCIAARNAA